MFLVTSGKGASAVIEGLASEHKVEVRERLGGIAPTAMLLRLLLYQRHLPRLAEGTSLESIEVYTGGDRASRVVAAVPLKRPGTR